MLRNAETANKLLRAEVKKMRGLGETAVSGFSSGFQVSRGEQFWKPAAAGSAAGSIVGIASASSASDGSSSAYARSDGSSAPSASVDR